MKINPIPGLKMNFENVVLQPGFSEYIEFVENQKFDRVITIVQYDVDDQTNEITHAFSLRNQLDSYIRENRKANKNDDPFTAIVEGHQVIFLKSANSNTEGTDKDESGIMHLAKALDLVKIDEDDKGVTVNFIVSDSAAKDIIAGQNFTRFGTTVYNKLVKLDTLKTKEIKQSVSVFVNVYSRAKLSNEIIKYVNNGFAIGEAQALAANLINLPSNVLTPTALAEFAKDYFGQSATVHGQKFINENKMGAFAAVAKGSVEKPKIIEIVHTGTNSMKPHTVFVGKGLTFDAGGISLKPASGMGDMKGDMGGAAMVIATMYLVKKLNLQVNLVGLVFACENMPDAGAYKPGDVVTAMNGTTIEITNTDAEGRLVLADALCYSQKFSPELVFDFATLTGAIVSALGHNYTGIFTNNEYSHTLSEVMHAGKKSKHKVWRLPLDKEHTEALKSDIADISHTGASSFGAGSSTAAAFLKEFVPEKAEWIHFDIAGTAMKRGKMADGSPFPLIGHFLLDQSL